MIDWYRRKAWTNIDKEEFLLILMDRDLAEENANAETSGLRYHKHLSVVVKRDSWLDKVMGGIH